MEREKARKVGPGNRDAGSAACDPCIQFPRPRPIRQRRWLGRPQRKNNLRRAKCRRAGPAAATSCNPRAADGDTSWSPNCSIQGSPGRELALPDAARLLVVLERSRRQVQAGRRTVVHDRRWRHMELRQRHGRGAPAALDRPLSGVVRRRPHHRQQRPAQCGADRHQELRLPSRPTGSESLRQSSLTQDRIGSVAARDADWYREVTLGDRTVPNFVAAASLPDHRAAGGAQQIPQFAIELRRHSACDRFGFA